MKGSSDGCAHAILEAVKRTLAWIAGLAGIAALARLLTRSRAPLPPHDPDTSGDPAEELRRRLSAQREATPTPPEPDTAEAEELTLEERRARVHAKAHEAIDSMRELSQ